MTRARRVVVGARRVIGNVHRHLPAGLMVAFPTSKQIWADLMANEAFIAGFWGWLIAQVTVMSPPHDDLQPWCTRLALSRRPPVRFYS